MIVTNHERICRTFIVLRDALRPPVLSALEKVDGEQWERKMRETLRRDDLYYGSSGSPLDLDVAALLILITFRFQDCFAPVFKWGPGHGPRGYVSELRDLRNRWAHQVEFDDAAAARSIETAILLIKAFGGTNVQELEELRSEIISPAPTETRGTNAGIQPVSGLSASPLDRRMLMGIVQRVTGDTLGLRWDGPYSKFSHIGMRPDGWQGLGRLCGPSQWKDSEPALKFHIGLLPERVVLRLEIMDSLPDSLRVECWEFAAKASHPLRQTRSKMPMHWPKIYVNELLSSAQLAGRSLDQIEADLRRAWAEFVGGDLVKIDQAVTNWFGSIGG